MVEEANRAGPLLHLPLVGELEANCALVKGQDCVATLGSPAVVSGESIVRHLLGGHSQGFSIVLSQTSGGGADTLHGLV